MIDRHGGAPVVFSVRRTGVVSTRRTPSSVQQLGATLGVAVRGAVYLRGLAAHPGAAGGSVTATIGVVPGLVTCTAVAAAVLVRRAR